MTRRRRRPGARATSRPRPDDWDELERPGEDADRTVAPGRLVAVPDGPGS
jgi:hypothetical protein